MAFWRKKDTKTEADDTSKAALFGNRSNEKSSGGPAAQANPYAVPPPPYQAQAPSYRPPADNDRNALFAGRSQGQGRNMYAQQPPPQQPAPGSSYGRPPPSAGGYGADRELTAEDEEEEDVEAIKQQIRFTKQQSVNSTRNALQVAAAAEETGRNTLARLGQQGERLHNTEKNLDITANHNRVAEEKARELKTLNGSMFAIHVKNPMKSKSRARAEEERILQQHQADREERERTRQAGFQSREAVGRALQGRGSAPGGAKMSLAERSKYQFEADESDEEKEREIDQNLDQLAAITGRLKGLAMATGEEVDRQNTQIDRIMRKSDKVDDQIAITHARIKKIR
ncbi:V-SNARE [Sphaerosporella brunnea]|uniref:V-SNARE n=1 Tax=Sphaerosporella brunnea TaxID=1250544 RepID=A0A5J5EQV1_9PEZI|nr:V-SNARE [Sphaerosporella brunnea]